MCSAIAESPVTLDELARACAGAQPRPHHSALLDAVHTIWAGLEFTRALTRGGWHRPGGVIGESGDRIAPDLQDWAERAWRSCGEDAQRLAETFGRHGLLATRIAGQTHYFVAPYGRRGSEFLQLEVEELLEVADRRLFDPDEPPADLQELVDPAHPLRVDPRPIAGPYYALRRLTDVHAFIGRMRDQSPEPAPAVRFLDEWDDSSAASAAHFSKEWVLLLGEHLDRFKQPHLTAKPVPAPRKRTVPMDDGRAGGELGAALHLYDRHAGYPFAWYFHLVANQGVPSAVASHVGRDLERGFDYLPARDVALLRGWLAKPYCV
jgi:hypothetical protein